MRLGAPSDSVAPRYGVDGGHTVTTASRTATAQGETFTVLVYVPSGAGPFPTVILASGLLQPALAYAVYARRMASWGIVTVLRDDPGLFTPASTIAADLSYLATEWLTSSNADPSSPLFGKLDASNVGLAGHSRGGQAALLAAEGAARGHVRGVFGIDPVDLRSPLARDGIASLGASLALLGETTDASGLFACAPASANYAVLYEAAASPAVAITAVDASHTMFLDQAHCHACAACSKGSADQARVLADAVRYTTSFFARQLLGDATVGQAFEGAGAPADVAAGRIKLLSK